MTAEVPTDDKAALVLLHDLRIALAAANLRFPELMLTDTADGDVCISLGRVRVGTAAKLIQVVNGRKSPGHRKRAAIAPDGWVVGLVLAVVVGGGVALLFGLLASLH